MIVAYLGLADALIADNRMLSAVQELEGSLVVLLRQGDPPTSVWRIETLLAAMYERLGNPIRARRASMDAFDHARRTGDKIAMQRAGSLMRRLMATRGAGPDSSPPSAPASGPQPQIRERVRSLQLRSSDR